MGSVMKPVTEVGNKFLAVWLLSDTIFSEMGGEKFQPPANFVV